MLKYWRQMGGSDMKANSRKTKGRDEDSEGKGPTMSNSANAVSGNTKEQETAQVEQAALQKSSIRLQGPSRSRKDGSKRNEVDQGHWRV